jgi:DNA modification methylase
VTVTILKGDCREVLRELPAESVHCVVTSPPYFGLRDYGVAGQIGLEPTPAGFVTELVNLFAETRRVLRDDGTLWLNLGDSYTAGKSGRSDQDRNTRNKDGRNPENAADTGAPFYKQRQVPDGLKAKDLLGIPWRVAFALQADGWYLRQDIIWSKPNPMPESVRDRCTKAHEYLFLLSKSERYYYDADAIKEDSITNDPRRPYTSEGAWQMDGRPAEQRHGGKHRTAGNKNHKYVDAYEASDTEEHRTKAGLMKVADVPWERRNRRSVWEVATAPYSEAHFATFPPALIEPCILAGCPKGGTVLDPFGGAGTTGLVADRLGRNAILIELNPEYAAMAERRIRGDAGMFAEVQS